MYVVEKGLGYYGFANTTLDIFHFLSYSIWYKGRFEKLLYYLLQVNSYHSVYRLVSSKSSPVIKNTKKSEQVDILMQF
jgi:hypothetical protein